MPADNSIVCPHSYSSSFRLPSFRMRGLTLPPFLSAPIFLGLARHGRRI
jgi:hypothetical protein